MIATKIEENLNTIKLHLEAEINPTEIAAVELKLSNLSSLMGLSAECMRYAKEVVLTAQKSFLSKPNMLNQSATNLKLLIESELHYEIGLFVYSERLNAAITHCCDSLRTIISKYKEELRIANFSN